MINFKRACGWVGLRKQKKVQITTWCETGKNVKPKVTILNVKCVLIFIGLCAVA